MVKRAAKGVKDESGGPRAKKARRAAGGEGQTDARVGSSKGPGVVDGGECDFLFLGDF
jgi:hypothetical protein